MTQLVMDKITSFLNHKHLLVLEQVSSKMKFAVDAQFSLTDFLIVGSLPEIKTHIGYAEATAMEQKCLNGLLYGTFYLISDKFTINVLKSVSLQ